MTDLTKDYCLGGTKTVMGGINLVGLLSLFSAHTDSIVNWRYATLISRLGEAAALSGGECGPCIDFASYALAFNLQSG
jgi:hypothetical protein